MTYSIAYGENEVADLSKTNVTFLLVDQKVEETWYDQQLDKDKDRDRDRDIGSVSDLLTQLTGSFW